MARRIRVPVGFVAAALYVWLAWPTWTSILYGSAIILPALVLRTAASGHVKKNQEVTTSGPYAYTRNPLYLGSIILVIGFGVASRNVWLVTGVTLTGKLWASCGSFWATTVTGGRVRGVLVDTASVGAEGFVSAAA